MGAKIQILITAPGFAHDDPEPIEILKRQGWDVCLNETGRAYSRDDLIQKIRDADAVLLGTETFDREVIDAAKRLKVISRYGVGVDNVDVLYAKEKGIQVCTAAGANATAVADMALAMMLAVSRKLTALDAQVRQGDWTEPVGIELGGKILGIVGFGNIGAQVASRARGFGMEMIAYDAYPNRKLAEETGVHMVDSLEALLKAADYVTLHVPHIQSTHHMIGRQQLSMMKDGAVLINTARGGVVDEAALAEALKAGKLYGAGLDVFEQEPLPLDSALLECPNVVLAPHTSADTVESARKVSLAAANNIIKNLEKI